MEVRRIAIVGGENARAKNLVQAWLLQYPLDIVLHLDDADQLLLDGPANYRSAPIDRYDEEDTKSMVDRFDPHGMLLRIRFDGQDNGDRTHNFCGQWRRLARQRGMGHVDWIGVLGDGGGVWVAGVATDVVNAVVGAAQL